MAVSKQQKVDILTNLVEKFKNAKSIGFAETSKLTVEDFSSIRTNLREVWSTYTLAKKTLIKKALKDALNLDLDLSNLPGQIWAVCSNEDAMIWLGKLNEYIKKNEAKANWTACIFEWEVKNKEETITIASMPSRETLLSRLVWSLQSPLSWLARFFDAAAKELETTSKTKVSELKSEKKEKASKETSAE